MKNEKAVISFQQAKDEITKWLDSKNYPQRKREKNEDQIEALAEAIMDGSMVLNEDNTLTHKLSNPITNDKGEEQVSELQYKARLRYEQVEPYLKGVKASDSFGLVNAYVCALSGRGMSIIKKLDTTDLTTAQTVATFFL